MSKKTFNDKVDELFDDLVLPSDTEIRKETGYVKTAAASSARVRTDEEKEKSRQSNIKFRQENPLTAAEKKRIGDAMRGKTLEELIGDERAAGGRKKRSEEHKGKKRPKEVVAKIASTRKATGSYDSPTHGMNGKTHKESTKEIQGKKAKIRQELKRRLGLGKNDGVPKDLLEKEYKKQGLL